MKNVISIIILIIVGLLAYNHFNKTYTPDEQILIDIEDDFNAASKLITQSERVAASSGVDSTSSFEEGIENIRDLRTELYDFISELKDEKLIHDGQSLLSKIDDFLTRQGYPPVPE